MHAYTHTRMHTHTHTSGFHLEGEKLPPPPPREKEKEKRRKRREREREKGGGRVYYLGIMIQHFPKMLQQTHNFFLLAKIQDPELHVHGTSCAILANCPGILGIVPKFI